jgi:hypothetical protein
MVVTRRKRRENKDVLIYFNSKRLEQNNNINYLGIITDSKLKFREHIIHTSKKYFTLIHALTKSAKLSWGLKHEALYTTHKGAMLLIMLYGAPLWIDTIEKRWNKATYSRVQ